MSTINSAIKTLEKKIFQNTKIAFEKSSKQVKTIKIGGTKFTLNSKALFRLGKREYYGNVFDNWKGKPTIVMTIGVPHENAFIVDVEYELNRKLGNSSDEDTSGKVTSFKVLSSDSETIKIMLFPEGYLLEDDSPVQDGKYEFKGKLVLENGDELSFRTTNLFLGDQMNSKFQGRFGVTTADGEDASEVPLYGVSKLGIAEFRRVEQEVSCYVPGEVSHIENIMAKEYKEKFKRKFKSVNRFTEREKSSERSSESELNTSASSDLSTEASRVINENSSSSFGANAGVQGKLKLGTTEKSFSLGSSTNMSNSSSASESNSLAQSYAQEVTERALERVSSKINEKRSERIVHEYEEHSKHGFDNTEGEDNFSGVYRWVDKIYKNKLINYGKRLMYEFAIPEPSRFLKEAIYKKVEEKTDPISTIIVPEAPKTLKELGVASPIDIVEEKYLGFAAEYDAIIDPFPEKYIFVSKAISSTVNGSGLDATDNATNHSLDIPDGYKCSHAKLSGSFIRHGGEGNAHTTITIGSREEEFPADDNPKVSRKYVFGEDYSIEKELPIAIRTRDIDALGITVTAKCVRKNSTLQDWQNKAYVAIAEAYQMKVEEYNDTQPQVEEDVEVNPEKVKFNPLFNRSLEKREIKRIAIDLLTKPFGINYARNNYGNSAKEVVKNADFERHASVVKFFEQAFEWDLMAYTFYPYFYGKEDNWTDLFQTTDAADPIFQAFLQSGMARAVVSVREGFEDAVNWFMATGEIWNGQGLIVDQDNEMFLSVADELRNIEGEVEETWETRIPTALTIIQAKSENADNYGLPCFDDDHDHSA